MSNARRPPVGLRIDVPGTRGFNITHLVLDFNGTLARDGKLLRGVATRLRSLARLVTVTVLTADTFGTVEEQLGRAPVAVRRIKTGRDKQRFVLALPRGRVAAIGNGRNDALMLRKVALSIAVVGPEGAASAALQSATVTVRTIADAIDLLLNPERLSATLRT